ncbi:MAG: hypothetical protein NUV88_01330 [Candidatus Kaiserbacteria bacterium]|nr:hypothetical protein [Candidatus Kaiserbacteria bacterium]
MLSVFPDILFLAPLSAFLIRIALALVFIYAGWKHFSHAENSFRYLAFVEFISAISIGAGAKMQIGALVGACAISFWLARPSLRPVARGTAWLALVMCISLLVTGSGAIAFDLPL